MQMGWQHQQTFPSHRSEEQWEKQLPVFDQSHEGTMMMIGGLEVGNIDTAQHWTERKRFKETNSSICLSCYLLNSHQLILLDKYNHEPEAIDFNFNGYRAGCKVDLKQQIEGLSRRDLLCKWKWLTHEKESGKIRGHTCWKIVPEEANERYMCWGEGQESRDSHKRRDTSS